MTQSNQAGAGPLQRPVRQHPRTFARFPADSTCPICGTTDEGETVLVPIAGTLDGNISEARPMHMACCVPRQWDEGLQLALNWPAP
jgi:hypothetical protein